MQGIMEHQSIKDGDAVTLTMEVRFTFEDNQAFRLMMNDLLEAPPKTVILDFKEVTYIDSSALGMLLLLRENLEESETQLLLRHPREQVAKMFDISKFSILFTIEI
jgi:anti-anti-sigma factor